MRNIMKKILVSFLVVSLCLSMTPVISQLAYAATDNEVSPEEDNPVIELKAFNEHAYVYSKYFMWFEAYNLKKLESAELILHYNPDVLRLNTDDMVLMYEESAYYGHYKEMSEGMLKLYVKYDEEWAHWGGESILGFHIAFDVIGAGDTGLSVEVVKKNYFTDCELQVITSNFAEIAEYNEKYERPADFEYEVLDDGTASITKYNGWDWDCFVTIPDTIDGYKVTEIGYGVFEYNRHIKGVKIPEGVRVIGDVVFSQCNSLMYISIPASVERIGHSFATSNRNLKSFYYAGDESQWKNIEFEDWSYDLFEVEIHYLQDSPQYNLGQVDGNETIDAADALLVLEYAVGLKDYNVEEFFAADVNEDARADAKDALGILKHAAGLIDEF